MTTKITIRDVARAAGVSEPVVSTVLNKVEGSTVRVSPQTRKRVENVARELNYSPNIMGRSLRQQRSFVIGLLLSEINAALTTDVIRGVQDVAAPRCYSPMVFIHGNAEQEAAELQRSLERRVDALIVDTIDVPPSQTNIDRYRRLAGNGLPIVELFGTAIPGVPRVNVDFHGDGRQAAQHLIDLGHRHLALVIPERYTRRERYWSAWEFWQGYREAVASAGLEHVAVKATTVGEPADTWAFVDSGRAAAAQVHDLSTVVTGVVCYDERRAYGLMHEIQRCGVDVPGQLSVVGYHSGDVAALACPPLTAFDIATRRVAQVAAEAVFELMEGTSALGTKVASQLTLRQSTAKPPV